MLLIATASITAAVGIFASSHFGSSIAFAEKRDESNPYVITVSKANAVYSEEESFFGKEEKLTTSSELGNDLVISCGC